MVIRITRTQELPDPVRLARYRRSPDLGPKILFFSGGSALRKACRELIEYTHNSVHIITPFDSGGSSARLREAFKMPAIGDVRNRLLALADRNLHGNPEIFKLFAHRFSQKGEQSVFARELDLMTEGHHPLVADIPDPMRKIIRHHLFLFKKYMPDDFDLCKASIGNLILTGGYLDTQRLLDPVIYIFSKLVEVRGIVRPVINKYLHLITELENGDMIIGQHNLTGKEVSPISAKVKKVWLSARRKEPKPAEAAIRDKMRDLIGDAELICYPIGSFYSSVIANLLPKGVGEAVSKNPCPKVFIPNTGDDPEQYGLELTEQIEQLVSYLRKDDPENITITDVLNFVMLDKKNGRYSGKLDEKKIRQMGVEIIDCPLISLKSAPYIDEKHLIPIMLSLA
ncbi:GAK system CofD-like protein [Desulfonema magnum]|uniref:CofD-related protein, GAK system n=1 Tax=Desulfonema magnum TaxID=45655 RepID=A0A975BYJ6_9BACT|nr:GAK system CofD-like protein [Desulfonema magnum]QTA93637.1 CofD-related protein, GAK system [Desulfonema magnum]